jgi:hypothetical protein
MSAQFLPYEPRIPLQTKAVRYAGTLQACILYWLPLYLRPFIYHHSVFIMFERTLLAYLMGADRAIN